MLEGMTEESKEKKETEQKQEEQIFAYHELYTDGKALIEKAADVKLLPDIGCKTTGFHRIFKLAKPQQEAGITYHPDFWHYRPITIEEYAHMQRAWQQKIASIGEALSEFWMPLFMPKSANSSSPLQMYTLQLLELQSLHDNQYSGAAHDVGISFSPMDCVNTSKWPRAFIPEHNWFSDSLNESGLEPSDFLTLFPKAEQDLLALCFGRAVVGRTGHIPIGRTRQIEHTFRTMPVLFGAEPGQGKSTLGNYIINALKSVGYAVANFKSMNSRFNLGSVINSHIAFRDDCTSESLEANLRADDLKQAITNAQIRVEDKGTNAIELWSHAFFFTNVNKWDANIVYRLDSGIMARVAMLSTKFNTQLESEFKDQLSPYPYIRIPALAEKYGCSINALMLYFLRMCADRFLELIESENKRALELEVKHLTSKLVCQFNDDILPCITNCMQLSYMLRCEKPESVFIPELTNDSIGQTLNSLLFIAVDKSAHDVRTLIKLDWEAHSRPENHAWKAISRLKAASIDLAKKNFDTDSNLYKQDIQKLIKLVFSSFCLKDGFSVSSGVVYVTSAWQESRINQERHKALAKYIHQSVSAKVLDDLFNKTADTNHLYTFGYDAQQQARLLGEQAKSESL